MKSAFRLLPAIHLPADFPANASLSTTPNLPAPPPSLVTPSIPILPEKDVKVFDFYPSLIATHIFTDDAELQFEMEM